MEYHRFRSAHSIKELIRAAIDTGRKKAVLDWQQELSRERAKGHVLYRGLWIDPKILQKNAHTFRWREIRRIFGWIMKLSILVIIFILQWKLISYFLLPTDP